MGRRSSVHQLPQEIREALERRLIQGAFSGYVALEEWLAEQGFEISKSAIHRFGQRLERQMAAIKASTEMAKAIVSAAPDEEDSRSAAVISLVQAGLFDAMLGIEEAKEEADPVERLRVLSRAATAIADVGRASVGQKRYAETVRARAAATADAVAATVRKGGLSDDAAETIRRQILGIPG